VKQATLYSIKPSITTKIFYYHIYYKMLQLEFAIIR